MDIITTSQLFKNFDGTPTEERRLGDPFYPFFSFCVDVITVR
jgi:hypothetical protein